LTPCCLAGSIATPPAAIVPAPRGKVIHRIGDLIERHADELAMLETLGGLPVQTDLHRDIIAS
jgi:acyl-CoA reductase-like NAD-dependent aldehyde dehydrogenase